MCCLVLSSLCCWFYLQAEGGTKAGAVAKVVAAVDLARIRQPVHVEGGRAEEVETVEAEMRQQTVAMSADQQYQIGWMSTRMQAGQMLTAAQEFTSDLQSQVRSATCKEKSKTLI